jgi:hypothetical protein
VLPEPRNPIEPDQSDGTVRSEKMSHKRNPIYHYSRCSSVSAVSFDGGLNATQYIKKCGFRGQWPAQGEIQRTYNLDRGDSVWYREYRNLEHKRQAGRPAMDVHHLKRARKIPIVFLITLLRFSRSSYLRSHCVLIHTHTPQQQPLTP